MSLDVENFLSSALAEITYLRLDCANDPLQANLDMDDNQILNVDNITFNDVNGQIAGIQNQYLLSAIVAETIFAKWTFTIAAPSAPHGSGSERWGNNASAAGPSSTAIGSNANASGQSAFAGGGNAVASALGSFAIGNAANASMTGATAIGWNAKATAAGSFAMGALTQVSGTNSVGIAYVGGVSGSNAVAIGSLANVAHNGSVGIGLAATSTKANQFIAGSTSNAIVETLFGNGATHTAPQAQLLVTTTSGSGTDIAATHFVIQPGAGTGAGTGGDFIVKTATPGASGSTLNTYTTALTIDDQQKALFAGEVEIDGDLNHDGSNIGFFGTAPVAKQAALTTALTQITHTGPTTPDYAIATPVDSGVGSAWGFSTQDEFETLMSVVLNLQTRVDELELRLQNYGLLN